MFVAMRTTVAAALAAALASLAPAPTTAPPTWHPRPAAIQPPQIVTPTDLPLSDETPWTHPLNATQVDVQFVLLPDGSTAMLNMCGNCAGWAANALLQSLSTDHGSTWSNFTMAVALPPPPICNKSVCSRQPSWNTPQLASSPDRTSFSAVTQLYPYADMAMEASWQDGRIVYHLDTLTPAFLGRGSDGARGVDSGRIGPIVRLPSGRTLFSFEWDNFSEPDASSQHANITIAYKDEGEKTWQLSKTQAPAGHPIVGGEVRCDGANEPSSVALSNGTLLTLIRTQTGRLWRTLSFDNGTNLQPATETSFTSSDSPAMLLTLRHPSWPSSAPAPILMLWSNCATSWPLDCAAGGPTDPSGDCLYAARFALHGSLSLDDGATWRGGLEVFADPHEQIPPLSESGDYGAAYPYGVEQADGTVIIRTGQSGTYPKRWGIFRLDPRWLLQEGKAANWTSAAAGASWNASAAGSPDTVTPCLYRWNLCKDPHNTNRTAPHCDRGGSGVRHTATEGSESSGICVEHDAAATQATVAWSFPSAAEGRLELVLRLNSDATGGFAGANISLSDFLAPSFDQGTDWGDGRFASLAVLPIYRKGRLDSRTGEGGKLPLDKWLSLSIVWSHQRYAYRIANLHIMGEEGWTGSLIALRQELAMPPSYLRVRSLGAGAVCLRSANMTRGAGLSLELKSDDTTLAPIRPLTAHVNRHKAP